MQSLLIPESTNSSSSSSYVTYNLLFVNAAPATPKPEVCAVYDRTKTLQTILSTWNEVVGTEQLHIVLCT